VRTVAKTTKDGEAPAALYAQMAKGSAPGSCFTPQNNAKVARHRLLEVALWTPAVTILPR
jgi:hypothetical protein